MIKNAALPRLSEEDLRGDHLVGLDFKRLGTEYVSPFAWFVQVNGRIPSMVSFGLGKYEMLYKKILKAFPVREGNISLNEEFSVSRKKYIPLNWTIFLKRDLAVFFREHEGLSLIYGHGVGEEEVNGWIDYLRNLARAGSKEEEPDDEASDGNGMIYLMEQKMFEGLRLRPFEIPKPQLDVDLHYNDDFRAVHESILRRLQTAGDSGLVLLHGDPGTGKTTYIRYLSFLVGKRIIYIPPNVAANLASVDFVTFMLQYPNSVLVIEDAESIITGKPGRTETLAGLLNITDGLLGDCLNLQIVCTFNTDIYRIDKALLRKGRLIELYEFRRLTREKASALLKHLGKEREIDREMTLADVFNIDDPLFNYGKRGRIGFKPD